MYAFIMWSYVRVWLLDVSFHYVLFEAWRIYVESLSYGWHQKWCCLAPDTRLPCGFHGKVMLDSNKQKKSFFGCGVVQYLHGCGPGLPGLMLVAGKKTVMSCVSEFQQCVVCFVSPPLRVSVYSWIRKPASSALSLALRLSPALFSEDHSLHLRSEVS